MKVALLFLSSLALAACRTTPDLASTVKDAQADCVPGPLSDGPNGAKFVCLPAGQFEMGSPANEVDRNNNELRHHVTLTTEFEMQTTPLTQAQWVSVMGSNPSIMKYLQACPDQFVTTPVPMCPNSPVDSVAYHEALAFAKKLTDTVSDGYTYRLPTEAEWEYAARAGSDSPYGFQGSLDNYAWYGVALTDIGSSQTNPNSGHTHPVATKSPNAWGLYDMLGNVRQWVADLYGIYPSGPVTDPTGAIPHDSYGNVIPPSSNILPVEYPVARGCSFESMASVCRAAARRYFDFISEVQPGLGFRLVRVPTE